MLNRRQRLLSLAATITASVASTSPASAAPPTRVATCAAIAKETRALVVAALAKAPGPVAAGLILEAIAPLGTCTGPVLAGGQWALVLNTPPELENQDLENYDGPESDPDDEGETPKTPTTWTVVRDWTPVFVTADGRRVALKEPLNLPIFEAYLDSVGRPSVPSWNHDDASVDPFIGPKANPDGSLSAAFVNSNVRVAMVRFDGKAVVVDPAQVVLPSPSALGDLNGDGRDDLSDNDALSASLDGANNLIQPFDLIAIARPDGTFTTDDPFITATYRKRCEGLGRSPWVLNRRDTTAAITNMACARLFGVPLATLKAGLNAEKDSIKETDDSLTIHAIELLQESFELLVEWLDGEVPSYTARTDGYRAVPVGSATASTAMKAFGVYLFDATQAVDGDLGTSWQPKKGKDAWIELKLKDKRAIAALDIANGFQRTDKLGDLFALNSRGARITVTAGDKTFELALDPNARGLQRIDFPEAVTTDTIRVTFKATAKGKRWDHLAVSELVPLTR